MDKQINLMSENTPPQLISDLDIWKNTANFRFFGSYDYGKGLDNAVKDILQNKIPIASRSEYQTILGSFVCGSAYSIISQTYTSVGTYGSAIVFGYGSEAIGYYRMNSGVIKKAELKCEFAIIQCGFFTEDMLLAIDRFSALRGKKGCKSLDKMKKWR